MNTKLKGVLQLLVILLVTAAVCVVAYTGIGGAKDFVRKSFLKVFI